jgi:anti-sigma regulatory factor (Ser/Thr protein kinase)
MKIEIPANLSFVSGIRNCIALISGHFGFNEREIYHIATIVDEICVNAVEHGSRKRNSKVKVECRFKKFFLNLVVKDEGGKKFNVEKVLRDTDPVFDFSNANNIVKSGHGLRIVSKLSDQLQITSGKQGTTIFVIKNAVAPAKNKSIKI